MITKEERFLQLIEGLTLKTDYKDREYPDSVFYYKQNLVMIEIIEKKIAWIRYDGFWNIFEKEYNMDYDKTREFMNNMIEIHLNRKVITSNPSFPWLISRWKSVLTNNNL
jgi:hypothetical protein